MRKQKIVKSHDLNVTNQHLVDLIGAKFRLMYNKGKTIILVALIQRWAPLINFVAR